MITINMIIVISTGIATVTLIVTIVIAVGVAVIFSIIIITIFIIINIVLAIVTANNNCYFQFISHKNCQQVMQGLWIQHHSDVMWLSTGRVLLHFVPRILALPFVWALYFVFPYAPWYRSWHSPIMRFLGDLVSYVVFLALLAITVARGGEGAGMRTPGVQVHNNTNDLFCIG